jgi:hypothetical protein
VESLGYPGEPRLAVQEVREDGARRVCER